MQCSQFTFVCIYPSHFHCMAVVSVILSQTTSHMVLVRLEGNRCVNEIGREPKWSKVATGLTMRQSTCEKDNVRAEMKRNHITTENMQKQRDTASQESKAKEKDSDRSRKKQCIHRESLVETGRTNA